MRDVHSYLAGMFDGEGCVTAQHAKLSSGLYCTRLLCALQITDSRIPPLFAEHFGGNVGVHYLRSGRPIHRWHVVGSNGGAFLEFASKFCLAKAIQASEALQLAALLLRGRAKGRRITGQPVVTEVEAAERLRLCESITSLKKVPALEGACSAASADDYLAGVFDAEGCISARRYVPKTSPSGRKQTSLHCSVGMTDAAIPKLFAARFGGQINEHALASGRTIYNWYISNSNCRPLLEHVADFGLVKKEQAVLALDLAKSMASSRVSHGRNPQLSDPEQLLRTNLCERITAWKHVDV